MLNGSAALPQDLQEILFQVSQGKALSRAQSLRVADANVKELKAVFHVSGRITRHLKGKNVTYSRKIFLPLTNLCRDFCSYCTFRKDPSDPSSKTMTPREVLQVAELGRQAGCKEALFSLGERPEERYQEARDTLRALGYGKVLEYLRAMCQLIIERTPLLPHANPGTLTKKEMHDLRPVNASMGLMLENVSARLLESGGPHRLAPSKHPKLRLRTIENAGQLKIPFTTGILIGIGETVEERVDSLIALRELHRKYNHIQEVIIQNFRAKHGTPMQGYPEPTVNDMLRTISLARLIMPELNIQAPPNLSPDSYRLFPLCGTNDWGGISPVTIDHINPEAAWPEITRLSSDMQEIGLVLRERLAVYPEYILKNSDFIPDILHERIFSMIDDEGLVPAIEKPPEAIAR